MAEVIENTLTRKDFISDQEVRWCPGCGDYAILAAVQKVFPELGVPKENFLIVSGIGCSSRFPYYMDTYGFHSIHGRAPAFASGAKLANPDLSVWIVTGDGDAMSIGGNHFIHVLRRNLDVNILMFNNRIYGLTKGQYSPTSELGKVTKSTPMGSLDYPFNPPSLALGSGATFVARTIDRELKHLASIIKESHGHKGGSFVEIYQNCNIFNDGAFANMTDRETKMETQLVLEEGQPMIFGKDKDKGKGLVLNGSQLSVLQLGDDRNADDVLVHNSGDKNMARLLAGMTYNGELPTPIGVMYQEERATYDEMMTAQLQSAVDSKGPGDLDALIKGSNTWTV
jgi:2-oxoglutarate ferredoxin oxidoreductase subunit beta